MQHRPLKQLCGLVAGAAVILMLVACDGKTGSAGANGTNGTNGTNGSNGTNGTNAVITVNAAQLTSGQWAKLTLKGTVNSVTMGGAPVVNFTITDGVGTPVSGLATQAANGNYTNFAFAISKLVPGTNGSPSRWVCYNVVTTPAAGQAAVPYFTEPENNGALKDNLDGTYTYTFALDLTKAKGYVDGAVYDADHLKSDLDDLTYEPTLTHRVIASVGGNQPGTTTQVLTPANLYYDFIPSTGKPVAATDTERVIVDTASCNTCHTKLSMHANFFPAINDTHLCVVCHTDQLKYGSGDSLPTSGNVLLANGVYGSTQKLQGMALANFPNMVHHIHTGELLYYQGYNQFLPYNEVTYPQDLRNCTKCHTQSAAAPQGDNWTSVPSRLACGACHDSIIWTSGVNHAGGAQLSDQNCTGCHGASQMQVIHTPVVAPNPNNAWLVATGGNNNTNASYVAGYTGILPAGAHLVTWDFQSVSLNTSRQPVFVFRFLEDGLRKDLKSFVSTASTPEFWDNYAGGPSVYLTFSLPQDGIATPADWNASVSTYVKNIWRGDGLDQYGNALAATAAGTLSGPDASGYYTLTMTGVVIPATATNLTGGIGYTYGLSSTQPLTQTDVAGYAYTPLQVIFNTTTSKYVQVTGTGQGGVSVPAPNVIKLVSGSTARRAIVSNQKCNDCHATLGIFTEKVYHAGQRNDAPTCTFCHNVNRVNNGWGVNIKDAVHALHSADKRANKYSWEAAAGDKYWEITYPAILNNCEACHVPGSYDFRNSASAAALPNLLWTTVATGTVPNPVNVIVTGTEAIPGTYWSPFVTAGAVYGSGFTTNFAPSATTAYADAAATTLVSSPITAACSNCHDAAAEIAHFRGNGGAFYEPRATALLKVEQCLVCHGAGRTADIKAVHMTFK